MVFVPVVVLQVVERMMLPDPKFDHFTPGLFGCGLVEFLGPLEKPSGESGGPDTRVGSEGQVEHPYGGGCGIQ